jgi:diguanylate cyclase (GGDEF)-like protein
MARPVTPRHFIDSLDELSRRGTWAVLAFACLAFMIFDMTTPEVGTGPLYIPLIALAGWRLGPREAFAVALVATLLNIFPIHGVDAGMSAFMATIRGVMRLGAYAFVTVTVCGLRRVYDRERSAARHDALTGVLNRTAFEAHARTALETRRADDPVTVLALADIDGFKSVNDTAGHAEGDEVLRMFAKVGADAIGKGDRFGRLGGDEFVLLLQAETPAAALSRIEMMHRDLRDGLEGSGYPVGVSMGAVVIPPGTNLDWTTALREADRLMYVAKRAGEGGFQVGMSAGAVAMAPSEPACAPSLIAA